jgi:hypothetical protein
MFGTRRRRHAQHLADEFAALVERVYVFELDARRERVL